MPVNKRICPKCGKPVKLMLPPGGDGPRTYQCAACDRPDPLKSPDVVKLVKTLAPPEQTLRPGDRKMSGDCDE